MRQGCREERPQEVATDVTVTEFLTSGSQRPSMFLKHLEHKQKFIYLLRSVSNQWYNLSSF